MTSINLQRSGFYDTPNLLFQRVTRLKKYAALLLFGILAFHGQTYAQTDLTKCYGSCTSGDFTITKAFLTDINGVPITSAACSTPGNVVSAYLSFTFTNSTNSDRNGIFISGTINGNYIFKCFPGILPKKSSTTFTDKTHAVQWTCGTDLTLKGTFISWGSAGEQVCDISCSSATPSKCRTVGDVLIQTPLSNNFTFSNKCVAGQNFQTVDFVGAAAGGDHSYKYAWDFGDGSTSTLQSPSHTYTSANTFTVKFTVTDGTNTSKSVTKSVVVIACCTTPTVTTQPAAQTKCDNASASFTVASSGGNPAPTIQWQVSTDNGGSWTNLSNGSPYSNVTGTTMTVNPVTTALNGNKYRAVLTSGTCTPANSDAALLTVNSIPGAPTVGVVDNCNGTSTLTVTGLSQGATITWTDDATNHTTPRTVSSPGTYSVTQTVNSCTSAAGSNTAAPKTTPGAPSVSATNNCDGTSTLTVTGVQAGAVITWTDDATNHNNPRTVSSPGSYSVTQTLNGCTSAAGSATAAPKTTPAKPAVGYNAPACDQTTFSVTISSVTSGATYSIFDKNGNTIPGVSPGNSVTAPNSTSFNFSNIPAGSGYQVTVTNNGCLSDANTCGVVQNNVTNKTQLAQSYTTVSTAGTKVLAAPNPFNNKIRFSITPGTSGRGSLELYNLLGQKVKTVFEGTVQKGQMQTVEYNVPDAQRSFLIYQFHVGTEHVSGKLVGLK